MLQREFTSREQYTRLADLFRSDKARFTARQVAERLSVSYSRAWAMPRRTSRVLPIVCGDHTGHRMTS
jgi:hypothetical protein